MVRNNAVEEFMENKSIKGLSALAIQFSDNGEWVKKTELSVHKQRYYDSLYWALYEELGCPKRKKNIAFVSKDSDNEITVTHSQYSNQMIITLKKIKQDIEDFVDTFSD